MRSFIFKQEIVIIFSTQATAPSWKWVRDSRCSLGYNLSCQHNKRDKNLRRLNVPKTFEGCMCIFGLIFVKVTNNTTIKYHEIARLRFQSICTTIKVIAAILQSSLLHRKEVVTMNKWITNPLYYRFYIWACPYSSNWLNDTILTTSTVWVFWMVNNLCFTRAKNFTHLQNNYWNW